MSPDDRVRLQHMVDAIATASRFVEGRKRSDLEEDQMLVFALVRAVEIIGALLASAPPFLSIRTTDRAGP